MVKFSQKNLETIENFCGEYYAKRCRTIQDRREDSTVRIVNTGMVSSGKSSLYNALINSAEEYFPTGAARTTTEANYFDYNNISYIDTPGIDVRSEDDTLAFSTIMESDIIVMIHNIRTGPLNRSEVEWLENIVRCINSDEMCSSRIVFVISWKDTREKESDYCELISNVKQQVYGIVGTEIPFFEVSVKKYQQGIEKGKEVLIKNSGVMELKDYLEEYVPEYLAKKKGIDDCEYIILAEEIKSILQTKRSEKCKEKQRIYDRVCEKQKYRRNAWKQVFDYFSLQRRRLTDLENELKNMQVFDYFSLQRRRLTDLENELKNM